MGSQHGAPPASSVVFARGVIARLTVWSTLHLAVQEGWGGPGASEKRTWLASVIVDAFEEQIPAPDDQYVEELLLQVMEDEFEAILEDDSAESVAKDIVRMWDETRVGKEELALKFEDLAGKVMGKRANAHEGMASDDGEWMEDDDEDGSSEGEDAPQLLVPTATLQKNEPEVDEDGFTVVRSKGKSRR